MVNETTKLRKPTSQQSHGICQSARVLEFQSARVPDCQAVIGGLHQVEYLHSRGGHFGLEVNRIDGVEYRVSSMAYGA